MTEDSDGRWADQARQFADNDMNKVRSALGQKRKHLGFLFNDMQGALNWAVDVWLCLRGQRCRTGWHDQEARFLRLAPQTLQDEYLQVAGGVTPLAGSLLAVLGTDRLDEVLVADPSLDAWRQQASAWLMDAEKLVNELTSPELSPHPPGANRIESGVLRGRFDGLTPCLLLVQEGKTRSCCAGGKTPRGIFDLGEFNAERRYIQNYNGLILSLSLCRDTRLRESLEAFAKLLLWPAGGSTRNEVKPQLPSDIRGRRLALQAWLDEAGLSCLKMVDQEPVTRWTRFYFTPEATQAVLCKFDYVTAVEDGPGQPIRTIEHEAFRWKSHGDLLDWRRLDSGEDMPMIPFRFCMVSALSARSILFPESDASKRLFRPLEYWAGATTPNRDMDPEQLLVHLEQYQLLLTLGAQTAEIGISEIYDPFPELLEWLQSLADGDLPIGVAINEDGSEARIVAHSSGKGRLLIAVLDGWEHTVRTAGVVETNEFLAAFRREFADFLENRFDVQSWLYHEAEEHQTAYRDELLKHPFLVPSRLMPNDDSH